MASTRSSRGGRTRAAARPGALLGALLAAAPLARARAADADPAQPQVVGHVFAAGAGDAERSVFVLSAASYGYTESVLGIGDAHHRMAGALMVEGQPLPWLDLAFRVDGRYDLHILPGQPSDDGLVGDPRIYARVDRALGGGLRAAVRAGLWLPGRNAPSIDWSALSPEVTGAVSWVPATGPLSLSANAGYRLDRSANSATDAPFLSASDRLALEVSAFDQVLLGVAATLGRGRAQGFVEGSWDVLVGRGAPGAAASPIRLGGGARLLLGERVRLEAEAEVSPSARPEGSTRISASTGRPFNERTSPRSCPLGSRRGSAVGASGAAAGAGGSVAASGIGVSTGGGGARLPSPKRYASPTQIASRGGTGTSGAVAARSGRALGDTSASASRRSAGCGVKRAPMPTRKGEADAAGAPAPTSRSQLASANGCTRPAPYAAASPNSAWSNALTSRASRSPALSFAALPALRALRSHR